MDRRERSQNENIQEMKRIWKRIQQNLQRQMNLSKNLTEKRPTRKRQPSLYGLAPSLSSRFLRKVSLFR